MRQGQRLAFESTEIVILELSNLSGFERTGEDNTVILVKCEQVPVKGFVVQGVEADAVGRVGAAGFVVTPTDKIVRRASDNTRSLPPTAPVLSSFWA